MAATVERASVHVVAMPLLVQLNCASCLFDVVATSSGDITGVDGTTPYEVTWTPPPVVGATNLAGTILYGSSCLNLVWTGASLRSSTVTIQGASLRYGTSTYAATVTLTFLGTIVEGLFSPATSKIDINGGPIPISILVTLGPGAMAAVRTPPVATSCPTGTQTFTASGSFLTLG
jgi:hypothetical protein